MTRRIVSSPGWWLPCVTRTALIVLTFAATAQVPSDARKLTNELAALISREPAPALSSRASLSYRVNKKTPTFPFNTGISPAIMLQLPTFTGPYEIRVTTELKGTTRFSLFVPIVKCFDSHFNQTCTVGEEAFSLKYPSTNAEGEIPVSEINREERFLLIYTDASKICETAGFLKAAINASGRLLFTSTAMHRDIEGKVRVEVVH